MVVLSSSPVWYQSRGCDTSPHGVFAFASRNLIYLVDLKNSPTVVVSGILNGHTEKVTSCSFNNDAQSQYDQLVSGAEDCTVKVWDIARKVVLMEHDKHRKNVVSVHWNPVNPNLIYSGDEKGYVIRWNLSDNSFDLLQPDGNSQMELSVLACSPHNENLIAIGYKSGAVSVMKSNGEVIRKFRGHYSDITALVWSPKEIEEMFITSPSSDDACGLLLSGSKDAQIRVWSLSAEKCAKTYKLPSRQQKSRRGGEETRLYVALYWPKTWEDSFLSSSYHGEIIKWNLNTSEKNVFEVLINNTSPQQRIVFSINQGLTPSQIVTTSMDRTIKQWTLPSHERGMNEPDWVMPTLGGFVYTISVNPQDESTLALGVGDGTIRIWKTMNPRNVYDVTTLWQGVKEKVMSLAWHPTHDGWLAFGTEDGKVGMYDVLTMKPPVISETYHMKSVYSLSWGPQCYDVEAKDMVSAKLCIYSCGGDGAVLMHKPNSASKEAVKTRNIITFTNKGSKYNPGRHSDVEWKQDHSWVAMGNDNGSIDIYSSPHLCHIFALKTHNKVINCMKWKTMGSGEHLLASGSNGKTIYIHNISSHDGSGDSGVIEIKDAFRTLNGHLSRITGLAWNHDGTQLASSSYDGSVQIWEVAGETPLHNFRGHNGRVMCVAWSTACEAKDGVLYSGSDDYSVHRWFAEDQKFKEPPKTNSVQQVYTQRRKNTRKKAAIQNQQNQMHQQNWSRNSNNGNNEVDSKTHDDDLQQLLNQKETELLNSINEDRGGEENAVENDVPSTSKNHIANLKPDSGMESHSLNKPAINHLNKVSPKHPHHTEEVVKKRKLRNMFQIATTQDNQNKVHQHQDLFDIMQWRATTDKNQSAAEIHGKLGFVAGDGARVNLGLYTDRQSAHRMISNEYEKLKKDNVEGYYLTKVWSGDVKGALAEAEENKQLNDKLVSLAPVVGIKFWKRISQSYAKQLVSDGHPFEAAQHLIVAGLVYEAINLLGKHKMYREALALARARLDEKDEVLIKTVKMWAKKLTNGGSVELAAKCYCSIGDYDAAATCLAKRMSMIGSKGSDVHSLWAALSIARETDNKTLQQELSLTSLREVCTLYANWKLCHEVMKQFKNLNFFRMVLITHEILVCCMMEMSPDDKIIEEKAFDSFAKSQWNLIGPEIANETEENKEMKRQNFYCKHPEYFLQFVTEVFISEEVTPKEGEILNMEELLFLHEIANSFNIMNTYTTKQVLYQCAVKILLYIAAKSMKLKDFQELDDIKNYCAEIIKKNDKTFNMADTFNLIFPGQTYEWNSTK